MSDPLDAIRNIAPPAERHPELLERVRNDLMSTISPPRAEHGAPFDGTLSSPRVKRRWAIPLAAAVVLTTAASAWAITQYSSDSTAVQCPGNSIIDAVTGDPVADCTNHWRRFNDTDPPAMIAYDNGNGSITVLDAGDPLPDGYMALELGPAQNTTLIELEAALDDTGEGLSAACYNDSDGHHIARSELDRLGLASWNVTTETAADGRVTCAYFYLDPAQQDVVLIALETEMTTGQDDPYVRFGQQLTNKLEADCLDIAQAADLTRSLAAGTDVVIDGSTIDFTEQAGVLIIHSIDDPTASCTRSDVNVGGALEVTLRGPTN